MPAEPARQPIHIPKDAYADVNFIRALCVCSDWRTAREVNEQMARLAPERTHLTGEQEANRDRLDFATYAKLLEKRSRGEDGREQEYHLTDSGAAVCRERTDGNLTDRGIELLTDAVLNYSTANEARAAAQYQGHGSRPFLLLLRLLHEASQSPERASVLAKGIPKKPLSDVVCSLWTEAEDEISAAVERMIAWAQDNAVYDAEREAFVRSRYDLALDEYNPKVTNNPARLCEWLAKLGLVTVGASGTTFAWNSNHAREAREVTSVFGISERARAYLERLGITGPSLVERGEIARRYGSGEESNEHKLIKKLLISFADDPAVIGEPLTLVQEEFFFPTNDRADLIMRDSAGRFVTIEVEVDVGPGYVAGTLQAAKYREMFAILKRVPREEIRTMLVAFTVAPQQRTLANEYDIEVHEVDASLRDLAESVHD